MTEKEKMLSGMPYDTTAAELRQISSRGKNLMQVYSAVACGNPCTVKYIKNC